MPLCAPGAGSQRHLLPKYWQGAFPFLPVMGHEQFMGCRAQSGLCLSWQLAQQHQLYWIWPMDAKGGSVATCLILQLIPSGPSRI